MEKPRISLACASAFWGDTPLAVKQILRSPELDYIVFDYLSEVTMTLLARVKRKDPAAGYAPDFFTDVIEPHLQEIASRKIRLIANAGGLNPQALKEKIEAFAKQAGIAVTVACVSGDDLLSRKLLPEEVKDDTGRTHSIRGWITANAYLGARPVVEALETGADIVVTGRIVDSALVSAPAVHEFGWKWSDYGLLAQASLAGHIVECGTQCCGGNFTDWRQIPHPENVGFPIAVLTRDGRCEITKVPGTGGLVSVATVAEQIVYEIGDPRAYELPDVICDFSEVGLRQTGPDRVEVGGAKGRAPSDHYKVIATAVEGWKISTAALMQGGNAVEKAQATGDAVLARTRREIVSRGWGDFRESSVEALGGGEAALLRISAAHDRSEALELLAKEVAPASTSLAPGLTQLIGGRASPAPRVRLIGFPFPKKTLFPELGPVETSERKSHVTPGFSSQLPQMNPHSSTGTLLDLAFARSGDKGNDVNIGVVARGERQFEFLRKELTSEKVAAFFAKEFDDPKHSRVHRWEMPGIGALNFLLKDCLGGGGAYSLKSDPQGKAFAQRLLQMRISP